MKRNKNNRGFTLVELMIVIVIIGILAGAVVVNIVPYRQKAVRARALQDISQLSNALDNYYVDNGVYPTPQQGLQALMTKPTSPPIPRNWQGPYLKQKASITTDPWGNEFIYLAPGEVNRDSFDLFSYGADGIAGGEGYNADVLPWE